VALTAGAATAGAVATGAGCAALVVASAAACAAWLARAASLEIGLTKVCLPADRTLAGIPPSFPIRQKQHELEGSTAPLLVVADTEAVRAAERCRSAWPA
jgi:hypothetical protein